MKGAVNDASGFKEKLSQYGKIDDLKYLTNENATFENIRTAISDIVFMEKNPCEQVIFYFAGHGISDGFNTAYIAPYDFSPDKPYLKGIPMDESKKIIREIL